MPDGRDKMSNTPPGPARTRQASSALVWSFANTGASRLGTVAIGVVLARLLGPEAFGTYAVAYVALIAMLSFNELGVSLAIVRWEADPKDIAPTVSTISFTMSTLIFAAMYLGAPSFATAMGDSSATGPVRAMAVCVIVNGLIATPAALLQRYFRQDQRTYADQVNVWLGAFVSVALVLAGLGAWGLVIGRLTGAIVSGAMMIAYSPLPMRFGFNRAHASALFRFGLPLAGASIIVFAVGYVDQIVVGHTLGAVTLGYYVLAFNLASWPVSMFSQPLRSVAPALFARLQGSPDDMRQALRVIIRPLMSVALPACVLLAVLSHDTIALVYGDEWLAASDALRWLAILAAFRIIFELAYDYLVVLRQSNPILLVQLLWFGFLVPSVIVGAQQYGIEGVAGAQVVVALLFVLPLYLVLFRRVAVSVPDLLARLAMPIFASALLGLAAWFTARQIDSHLGVLATSGVIGLLVVGGLIHWTRGDLSVLRHGSTPESAHV